MMSLNRIEIDGVLLLIPGSQPECSLGVDGDRSNSVVVVAGI